MISDDEYLEHIVAGIHAVTSSDADVRWNERINGRQFDVVVRFRLGTLDYLVLVEVKNRTRRASAADLESFVTKARDNHANKAVFVTAAGFQEGALAVARRHGVDLFTVRFDETEALISPQTNFVVHRHPDARLNFEAELSIGEPVPMAAIEDARLIFADGRRHDLPTESTQMTYYADRSRLGDGRTLGDVMQSKPMAPPALGKSRQEVVALDEPTSIVPPDEYYFRAGLLIRVEMRVVGCMGRALSGNVAIEPTAFHSPVLYTNELTGERTSYATAQLPLNTEAVTPGRFYFQLYPLRYYHCAGIKGDLITWELIESFQRAQLMRSTFTQKTAYGTFYIPVSDKAIIQRLQGRLADYHDLQALGRSSPPILPGSPPNPPGFRTPPINPRRRSGATRSHRPKRQR